MRYSEDRKIGGISGRAIFAVVAVTILIGGFVFGYFVGKKIPPSYVAPSETKKQQQQKPQKTQETAQSYSSEEDAETSKPIKRKGSASAPSEEEAVEEEPSAPVLKKKKTVSPPKTTVRKETKSVGQPALKETDSQGAVSETFTVQVGAFKNQKEAEKLALRLEDKGYRALVKKVTANDILLHKVTVGEFVKRKDAEVFALKFRVTEGLDAFVTVRN